MRFCVWLIALLLAACSSAPTQRAPVIERLPESIKKPAPASTAKAAPATKGTAPIGNEKDWRPDTYTVKKGDTLYSIGLEFGYDYKELAQRNHINPPYKIYVGQTLKINGATAAASPQAEASNGAVATPMKTESAVTAKPLDDSGIKAKPLGEPPLLTEPKAIKEPYSLQAMQVPAIKPAETIAKLDATKVNAQAKSEAAKLDTAKPEPAKSDTAKNESAGADTATDKSAQAAAVDDDAIDWSWPAQGKVLAGFNESGGTKGLDIAGTQGQPVLAAASGKVVYSGAGLRGYGKLVIIKHNKTYLSAYAHNSQILVKEGQEVAKGQKIAEMGSTDADQVKLHFEIRRLGKPVDPSKYLAEKP